MLYKNGDPDGPPLPVLSAVKRQILPTKSRWRGGLWLELERDAVHAI